MTTNTSNTDLSADPETRAPETHAPGVHAPGVHGAGDGSGTPGKPKKRGLIWALLLLFVGVVAAYAVWRASQPGLVPVNPNAGGGGRGGGRGRGGLGPTPVVAAKARKAAVPVFLTGLGNAQAYYTVSVKTRVDGELMSITFKEGDFVQAGQVLAQIDPRPFQIQLEQAEGTLARDSALLMNAKLDLERYKTLLAQDAIPRQQLDTQTALVAQLEGTVKQDGATINNAKLQITYSRITAPITGRIGLRLTDPGNIVHASDANGILIITQLQPISVLFTIPEDSLPPVLQKLNRGVKLPVEAWNRDNSKKLAGGVVITVDNQIDQTTGTSKLKASFDNKDGSLFPNQFVNIRLLVDTMQNQVVIPSVALQHGQQGTFVFTIPPAEETRVKITPVQVGVVLDDNTTSIASGIRDGDQVVVDGTDRLQDGSLVRVRRPGEDPLGGGRGRGRGGRAGGAGGGGGGNRGGSGNTGRGAPQ